MKVTKTNVGDNKTNQKTAMDGWMDGWWNDGRTERWKGWVRLRIKRGKKKKERKKKTEKDRIFFCESSNISCL